MSTPALPRTANLTSALAFRRNLICISFSRGFSASLDSLFPEVAFSNKHDSVVAPQERGPVLKPRGSSFPVSYYLALLFLVSAQGFVHPDGEC